MKHPLVIALFTMVMALPVVPVFAAELLDVKPVGAGSDLAVEILADIPMTYTYYKVPGQARAVVDIADADPEKVEPLIVVNKGAVSSISVDKVQIAGMMVSRVIFNLVSDADISVAASADRKKLSVTFGGGKPANSLAEPTAPPSSPPAGVPATTAPAGAQKEEADPLGLDEPPAAPAKSEPPAREGGMSAVPTPLPPAAPAPTASVKLEPVVPASAPPQKHVLITAIRVGTSYVDIEANTRLQAFEQMKLAQPNRLVIDVPGAASSLGAKVIPVRRFGLDQIRLGRYPDHVRIVLDAGNSPFPAYEIKPGDKGLRIDFKER